MDSDRSYILFCPPHLPLRLSETMPAAIGRHSSCELVLRKDDISRRHAEVFPEGGEFRIRDLGSTNGTFLNGERIHDAAQIGTEERTITASVTELLLEASQLLDEANRKD